MVPVTLRNGGNYEKGMSLLRQMVLARAFPNIESETQTDSISEVFDNSDTLDRLCQLSGGHLRNLFVILFSCLQRMDTPISRNCLEDTIQRQRYMMRRGITDDEWKLIQKVNKTQQIGIEEEYQTLLRNMLILEYLDNQGGWFGINPILVEEK